MPTDITPKPRGGSRPGAGRKALPDSERKIFRSICLSPQVEGQLIESALRSGRSVSAEAERIIALYFADTIPL